MEITKRLESLMFYAGKVELDIVKDGVQIDTIAYTKDTPIEQIAADIRGLEIENEVYF